MTAGQSALIRVGELVEVIDVCVKAVVAGTVVVSTLTLLVVKIFTWKLAPIEVTVDGIVIV